MKGENNTNRGRLRGYMFELVVRKWLEVNGFIPIASLNQKFRSNLVKQERLSFTELRGRGCWHQIDIPCVYAHFIPFINPIKLLAEVKFYTKAITKEHVREFIGVVKDISENYFVPIDHYSDNNENGAPNESQRFSELGVFFSASGFDYEAEGLAYAHNIKTISYKNNPLVDKISEIIRTIEANDLYARDCISKGHDSDFKRSFYSMLYDDGEVRDFVSRFGASDGIMEHLYELQNSIAAIKSVFLGTTNEGIILQFFSESVFPDFLFIDQDEQLCEVYYEGNGYYLSFYMCFSRDEQRTRFYFIPPISLMSSVPQGQNEVLLQKERHFAEVSILKRIEGKKRIITLKLNEAWADGVRRIYATRPR